MHQPQARRAPPAPAPAAGAGAGELTSRLPPAAGAGDGAGAGHHRPPPPGRLFFMPAPAPQGQRQGHHRPPPPDADRRFFMPPPAPPGRGRSNNNQPPAAPERPQLPMPRPSSRPPHPSPPPPPPNTRHDHHDDPADNLRHPHPLPLPPPRPAPLPRPSSALASCLVATAFLLLSAGGAGAALFLLFRPRPPDIAVAAVRLPSFAAGNGTVAFTFEQTAAVRNPNRSPLAHFDSSLRVAYAGGELGTVYIPAGLIDGGRTKHVSATFAVPAIPVAARPTPGVQDADAASAAQQGQGGAQPPVAIEVDSLLVVNGRVNVLRVLTHHVQASKVCRVGVSPLDGTVLGFRC